MDKQKVLFICNGIALLGDDKLGMSGGDSRFFEIIKNSNDIERHILVAHYGDKIIEKMNIPYDRKYVIKYRVDPGMKSNLGITLRSMFQSPDGLKSFHGTVYSSCEHLYDVFPALRLKLRNKCTWFAVYHWVEDYPWREKRGGTPFLVRYLYWINRAFAGWLIKKFADKILAVSEPTKEKLVKMKRIKPERIKAVYCGVDYESIVRVLEKYQTEAGSKYAAVYMKRLSHGKGAYDLVAIWQEVCKVMPNAKLAIIGHGATDAVAAITKSIQKAGLEKNITLLGPIYDFEEKFRALNSARIFILPSYEENWAIVIGEAMAIKLPVICYDIKEIVPIWRDNVAWVPLGNVKKFAERVLRLLDDPKERLAWTEKGFKFIEQYDWKNIASGEIQDDHK